MILESWRIASEHITPRWWWVRVHDTPESLRRRATQHHPWLGRDYFSPTVLGCCQPEYGAEWVDADPKSPKNGDIRWCPGGYAGIIRLASEHLFPEIIHHEVLHASVHVYRMNVEQRVDLGDGQESLEREEDLAYIHGQLAADMDTALRKRIA